MNETLHDIIVVLSIIQISHSCPLFLPVFPGAFELWTTLGTKREYSGKMADTIVLSHNKNKLLFLGCIFTWSDYHGNTGNLWQEFRSVSFYFQSNLNSIGVGSSSRSGTIILWNSEAIWTCVFYNYNILITSISLDFIDMLKSCFV